jgi:catechol-2,3-dioxygenase
MPIGQLVTTTLDTRDPVSLAEFYCAVTGWTQVFQDDKYVFIGPGQQPRLAFQRVAEHSAPEWPSAEKQFHLDFAVTDLDEAERQLLALGASRPEFQPDASKYRVLSDPAGHQFCIMVF